MSPPHISMKPLSTHVFRTLLPALFAVLFLSGLILKLFYTRSMVEDFDKALANKASGIVAITEEDEDGLELEVNYESMSNYDISDSPDYFAVLQQNGNIVFWSRSLENFDRKTLDVGVLKIGEAPFFKNGLLPDGRPGRSVSLSYYPKIDIDSDDDGESPFFPLGQAVSLNGRVISPSELTLWLAVERETLDSKKHLLNLTLSLTGLLTALMLILTQFYAIRRAVKPIKNITERLESWKVSKMNQPLPDKTGILETDVLTQEFNSLLQRVNSSIKREKRFSADLAHEIRTPLTEMKLLLELHERWPEDTRESRDMTVELALSVDRMQRLVENLLAIGKSESGVIDISGTTVFAPLLEKHIKLHFEKINKKQLIVETKIPDNTTLSNGKYIWPRIIDNLLDNAIEYSTDGATIQVTMVRDTLGAFSFEVCNPAEGLTDADMPHIFSRLWRKDESRHSTIHSGLGLSLVKNYCELLGYQVNGELRGNTTFAVSIAGQA